MDGEKKFDGRVTGRGAEGNGWTFPPDSISAGDSVKGQML